MHSVSHLTSGTPTKSNLYLANSLAAAVNEPALYRLLTFQVPNLMALFCCLGHTKVSVQVRVFVNISSYSHTDLLNVTQLAILPVPCRYILSLMNFITNKQEIFQISSSTHTVLIQGISIIFVGQMPPNIVFKKVQSLTMTRQNLKQPYENRPF